MKKINSFLKVAISLWATVFQMGVAHGDESTPMQQELKNDLSLKLPLPGSIWGSLLFDPISFDNTLLQKVKAFLFRVASDMTDPVCKVHEFYRKLHLEGTLPEEKSSLANKLVHFVKMTGYAHKAITTTFPAIALRSVASSLGSDPYLSHVSEAASSKTLPQSKTFTLLTWNVCFVAAGYPITDGGVLPWSERIDRVIDKIVEKDADVNCLYETFDTKSAFYLSEKLKEKGYTHIYFDIGPQALGASSGIMVASKYAIENPEFTPFPDEALVGRAKYSAKGVFSFDLLSEGNAFAKVFATHLQHSEEPEFPTSEEIEARRHQMNVITDKFQEREGKGIIVTGDLNLDDAEFQSSEWQHLFLKGDRFDANSKTWGGDAFCAEMMGKRGSKGLNLDHTMVLKKSVKEIHTYFVETGFDAEVFNPDALSDHAGLYSEITLS
ncbi:MAG: endonuclease/exonuclease/phosphatase family protein [Chlamydiota bacterium]